MRALALAWLERDALSAIATVVLVATVVILSRIHQLRGQAHHAYLGWLLVVATPWLPARAFGFYLLCEDFAQHLYQLLGSLAHRSSVHLLYQRWLGRLHRRLAARVGFDL